MSRFPRRLGLALAALAAPAVLGLAPVQAAASDDVGELFTQGVQLLKRGRDQEALVTFQKILAADPSNEAAYELWKSTEHQVWIDLMAKSGQYELIARRLMSKAELGRKARSRDDDAIRELLQRVTSEDVIARKRAVLQLSADHGEYAVPLMLRGLADNENEDRRVLYMQALTEMAGDVVLPLIEALRSSDAFLRRNVALTLGYIGDPRANGMIAWLADNDGDGGVRIAARQALGRSGIGEDALSNFLKLGEAYHLADPDVLSPYMYSDVVWSWSDEGLKATDVPRALYGDELAKQCFYDALSADPTSAEALAGVSRVYVSQIAELEQWAEAGRDVEDLLAQANQGLLATEVAGSRALEQALARAIAQGDEAGGVGLCRVLASSAAAPSPPLWAALGSDSGAVRAEAAIALGRIAFHSASAASPEVISALGATAGRQVVRIAALIGPGSGALSSALTQQGMLVNSWVRGTRALASLRRIPGVDVVLVSDVLPDLTTDQVIEDIKSDARFESTPILVFAVDVEAAGEVWGELVAAVVPADASDLSGVNEAMSERLTGDRAEADRLATQAAEVLEKLGRAGHSDLGAATNALAGTLATRPNEVVRPALGALAAAGTLEHVAALLSVVYDRDRPDETRAAAANACAEIFSRDNALSGNVVERLNGVVTSGASLDIRRAAARAMSRLDLSPEVRRDLLRTVRVNLGTDS